MKNRKKRDIELCCNKVIQQWPCENPILPEQSAVPRVHRSEAMQKCSLLFMRWYRNKRFFDFLRQVHVRLRPLRSPNPYTESLPQSTGACASVRVPSISIANSLRIDLLFATEGRAHGTPSADLCKGRCAAVLSVQLQLRAALHDRGLSEEPGRMPTRLREIPLSEH